jgi:hypothetical protein
MGFDNRQDRRDRDFNGAGETPTGRRSEPNRHNALAVKRVNSMATDMPPISPRETTLSLNGGTRPGTDGGTLADRFVAPCHE